MRKKKLNEVAMSRQLNGRYQAQIFFLQLQISLNNMHTFLFISKIKIRKIFFFANFSFPNIIEHSIMFCCKHSSPFDLQISPKIVQHMYKEQQPDIHLLRVTLIFLSSYQLASILAEQLAIEPTAPVSRFLSRIRSNPFGSCLSCDCACNHSFCYAFDLAIAATANDGNCCGGKSSGSGHEG